MRNITNKIIHKQSVCQLYRSLLRNSIKIKSIPATTSLLSQRNPQAYINQLSYEIRTVIIEEFQRNPKKEGKLVQLLLSGISFNEQLDKLIVSGSWDEFLRIVEEKRTEIFNAQLRRGSYLLRKDEIFKKEIHKMRGRTKRLTQQRLKHREQRKQVEIPKDRIELIKQEVNKSKEYGRDTLRRYLGLLQQRQIIPIPSLLPYTREQLDTDQQSYYHVIDGVSQRAISEAYDKQYLQSIIIPSLEYDINKAHNFNKIEEIVNEKGPYVIKARSNQAGAFSIPYLFTPFRDKSGRVRLSNYIRKSILLLRMQRVWESTERTIPGENVNSDGGFVISGCQGFNDVMFPRKYYEELAWGEATFELFMKMHELEAEGSSECINLDDFSDWFDFLNITSNRLEYDFQQLRQEVREFSNSELESTRNKFQKQMNKLYQLNIDKFDKLVKDLSRYSVHKHSEIVSPTVTTKFKDRSKQLPIQERIGRGKTLGDFLEQQKLYHYHYGYKFLNRFKF